MASLLFDSITPRTKTLVNRVAFTAHTATLSADGVPGVRARDYYRARAAGGGLSVAVWADSGPSQWRPD